jgi:hypothetical protein
MARAPGKQRARRAGTPKTLMSERARPLDDQIAERLTWTPKQRLDYLLDMLAFEERARGARRVS